MNYKLNHNDNTPVYKQIIKNISDAIEDNEFPEGTRLPTEREMSALFNVARGTIKSALGELERQGKIRKIQGNGIFPVIESGETGKVFIESNVRQLVDGLVSLKLNEDQIKRIVIKEAWSRLKPENKISMGWVDCSIELLKVTAKQIYDKCNINVETFLVQDIIKNPELISGKFDLIATTVSHYDEVVSSIPKDKFKTEKVILAVSNKTVSEIAQLTDKQRVFILYRSENFLELVNDNLARISGIKNKQEFNLDNQYNKCINSIDSCDAIIVPPDLKDELLNELKSFNVPQIIVFEYILDKGSLIHLEEQAQRLWMKKNIT